MKDWLFIASAVTVGLLAALIVHNAYQEMDRFCRRAWRNAGEKEPPADGTP